MNWSKISGVQFSSVHLSSSFSHVWLFVTPWTTACQASLSIINSQSTFKLMSIESMMPSNHLILCPLLHPSSIFPRISVFSNESVLHIRWPKYWSFSFSISPSNEYSGLISLEQVLLLNGPVMSNRFQGIISDRQSAWRNMDGGSWHCIRSSDQNNSQEKEMKKRQNGCLRRPDK